MQAGVFRLTKSFFILGWRPFSFENGGYSLGSRIYPLLNQFFMPSHPSPPRLGKFSCPTVLLVEDHDGYRRIVQQALECFLPGWLVCEADGVQAATDVLRKAQASVLVCDLMLPDGTAADLVEQLPALGRGQTKVIVFSNHSEEALAPLRTLPQVHGCLTKEHGLRALAMMIEQTAAVRDPVIEAAPTN